MRLETFETETETGKNGSWDLSQDRTRSRDWITARNKGQLPKGVWQKKETLY